MKIDTGVNQDTYNEAIFDGVTGVALDTLMDAMVRGNIAEFQPPLDGRELYELTEDEVIDHAYDTRDAFLSTL